MSEFDKFLEENGIAIPDDTTEPVTEEETGESEFDRFIREYNEKAEAEGLTPIDMGQNNADTVSDKVSPVPGTGNLSVDVTDEVKASQQSNDVRDYDYFYGNAPEAPAFTTRLEATANDLYNFVTGKKGESEAQKAVEAYKKSYEDFEKNAQDVYDSAPEMTLPDAKALGVNIPDFYMDNELSVGNTVKVSKRLTRGENGLEVSYVLIPKPGSMGWQRIIDQAGRSIAQETLGMFEFNGEDQADFLGVDINLIEDSELAKAVPDFEQEGAEALFTDILTFGLPTMAAERVGKSTARQALKPVDTAIDNVGGTTQKVGRIATDTLSYSGGLVATALTENMLSQEGDQGLFFTPDSLQSVFPEMSDEELAEVALLSDGLVVNGIIDGLLGFAGKVGGFIGDKTRGAKGLIDPSFVRDESRKAALIGTATVLDPRLAGADRRTIAEGLRNLSMVLDENSSRLIQIGESQGEVDVDTVNALLDGAKKYIETTYQNLPADQVEQEARALVERAITLTRSQEGVEAIRQKQSDMLAGVNTVVSKEIDRVNPDGVTMQEASDNLVGQYQDDIARASDNLEVAEATKQGFESQLARVVQDDPYIADLVKDNDPTAFFDNEELVGRVTEMFGEEFRDAYREAYDAVKAGYEAIPNTPIGEEAATVFRDALQDAFRAMGPLDQSGDKAQSLLAAVDKVFKPKKVGEQMDELGLGVDPRDAVAKTDIMQSPEEMIAALGADIGFADLFKLKQELASLIKETDDSAVRNRLINLRNTITSAARTEDGEAVGILAHIIDQGGETAEKAMEADALFIATQSRFADTTTTQRLSEAANESAYQGANTAVPEGGTRRGQRQLETTAVNEIMPNMMADVTGNQFDSFVFAMDSALSRGDVSKPIADLYVAEGVYALSEAIRRGDEQSIDMIKRTFEGHITALRQLEDPIVDDLEEAMRRIADTQTELGDRILQADTLIEYATQAKIKAENSIVKNLVSGISGGAKSGTDITLSKMLRGDDAANSIKALMEEANRLPQGTREATISAIQSSLLRNLQDSIFTSSAIGIKADGVQTDAALGTIRTLTTDTKSNALAAIAAAFPDNPIMEETMRQTLDAMSDFNIGSRIKVARAGSPTAANAGIRDSVSTAILFTFGYMNPTAAAARRITAGQIEAMERLSEEEQRKILGTIMADPKAFADIARGVANNVDPSKLKILKDNFLEASRRYAQYEMRVGPQEDDVDEQTENIFGKAANMAQDAYNFVLSPFN